MGVVVVVVRRSSSSGGVVAKSSTRIQTNTGFGWIALSSRLAFVWCTLGLIWTLASPKRFLVEMHNVM